MTQSLKDDLINKLETFKNLSLLKEEILSLKEVSSKTSLKSIFKYHKLKDFEDLLTFEKIERFDEIQKFLKREIRCFINLPKNIRKKVFDFLTICQSNDIEAFNLGDSSSYENILNSISNIDPSSITLPINNYNQNNTFNIEVDFDTLKAISSNAFTFDWNHYNKQIVYANYFYKVKIGQYVIRFLTYVVRNSSYEDDLSLDLINYFITNILDQVTYDLNNQWKDIKNPPEAIKNYYILK